MAAEAAEAEAAEKGAKAAKATKIDDIISETAAVVSGVPQASVLGPILYLLYVNDIGSNNICPEILMFGDDTALISTGDDPYEVVPKLE